VAVDDVVGVVDGCCAAVASGDVAHVGGVDGLVGVSLACMLIPQVLGGSVDIPTSFSRRGGLSLGTVCTTALVVLAKVVCVLESVISRVVGSVCSRFVAHTSRSAVLPFSSPSLSPFSYPSCLPSSNAVLRIFSSSSFLNISNTSFSLFSLAR
jgi:hypothetical protein